MAGKVISVLGVLLATGGTVWSLWDIVVKTDAELLLEIRRRLSRGRQLKSAKAQRSHVLAGLACICVGALLQILGLFLL